MPTAPYFTTSGERVPSVTSVISKFKSADGLIKWAHRQGLQGIDLDEARNAPAEAGSKAHMMVEHHIKKLPIPPQDDVDKYVLRDATMGFQAYLEWERETKLKVIATEVPLVSNVHKYGGTIDAVVEDSRLELCIADWKTSNRVYGDHLVQLAAYKELWNENHPERPITGRFHLCRFSKYEADFNHFSFRDLSDAWEAFLLLRKLYDIEFLLRKRLGT